MGNKNKMKLTDEGLKDRRAWESAGYILPEYDREEVRSETMKTPEWIHFGAGNIFRAYQANLVQELLNQKVMETGLIAAEGYAYEMIEKMYHPHDNLSILVTLKGNGDIKKTVIGSIVESLCLDSENEKDFLRMKEIFKNPSLQMASFTITEKGYSLKDNTGEFAKPVMFDFKNGPAKPVSYMGKVAALLYERYRNKQLPIALVSMDNCSHNGTILYHAISSYAKMWCDGGIVDSGFIDYINDSKKVSFPWSMIDKITPRPDAKVKDMLNKDEIEDLEEIITDNGTYAAPFVNAEESEYLVIEDWFPNGRPKLESCGVMFTDRQTVDKVEKMKVCTCLNPLHTALAIFGCLLDYHLISEEIKNPVLRRMVEIIGYEEGLPVVINPGIIKPEDFIDDVLNVRIPNPFMPDTPQRIATDTSQKLAIRFGETIKAYQKREDLNVSDLKVIPFVFAGWLRYLMGINDKGEVFQLSPDPLIDKVRPYVMDILLGEEANLSQLKTVLSDASIFGVDLIEIGMADLVLNYFNEMIQGVGAVEITLAKYIV